MIAQGTILLVLGIAAGAVGRYGMTHTSELVDMISDPSLHGRRERSVYRGSVATIGVGVLLAVAAVASFAAAVLG